jgi:thiazole/oxazole-forming peptide maturase SagC family component
VTNMPRGPRVYALREGVRVFRSGEEVRFRKGVWSYSEAAVRLSGQGERAAGFFGAVYEALVRGGEADADEIVRSVGAGDEEAAAYHDVLDELRRQMFLRDASEQDAARIVSTLLGGGLGGVEAYAARAARPVLFYADSVYARDAAKGLAREVGLPLDVMDESVARELAQADLTTRTDAVGHADTMARLGRIFHDYSCVLGCVATPNLTLLRNMNRLLVEAEKPLILGLIDGPFMSLLATLATQSGCFECYEQRMLARLEDMTVYQQFVEATAGGGADAAGAPFAPPLHLLTAAVISEGYLYSALSMLRLAGRIINIYLPLLEIQAQDLLRVPYCPACGFISKAQMNEMYTSSKRLVGEMLARVELEG